MQDNYLFLKEMHLIFIHHFEGNHKEVLLYFLPFCLCIKNHCNLKLERNHLSNQGTAQSSHKVIYLLILLRFIIMKWQKYFICVLIL
jgi:hypothetical protein